MGVEEGFLWRALTARDRVALRRHAEAPAVRSELEARLVRLAAPVFAATPERLRALAEAGGLLPEYEDGTGRMAEGVLGEPEPEAAREQRAKAVELRAQHEWWSALRGLPFPTSRASKLEMCTDGHEAYGVYRANVLRQAGRALGGPEEIEQAWGESMGMDLKEVLKDWWEAEAAIAAGDTAFQDAADGVAVWAAYRKAVSEDAYYLSDVEVAAVAEVTGVGVRICREAAEGEADDALYVLRETLGVGAGVIVLRGGVGARSRSHFERARRMGVIAGGAPAVVPVIDLDGADGGVGEPAGGNVGVEMEESIEAEPWEGGEALEGDDLGLDDPF